MKDIFDYDMECVQIKHCICPKYEKMFQILGKRWNGLIIEVLHQKECRFSELSREIEELSDRVLAERLRELEQEGIVEKNTNCGDKIKFMYRLTEKGEALALATQHLKLWAEQWIDIDHSE